MTPSSVGHRAGDTSTDHSSPSGRHGDAGNRNGNGNGNGRWGDTR